MNDEEYEYRVYRKDGVIPYVTDNPTFEDCQTYCRAFNAMDPKNDRVIQRRLRDNDWEVVG